MNIACAIAQVSGTLTCTIVQGKVMPRKLDPELSAHARASLDAEFEALHSAKRVLARPSGGWIRAVREALGMRSVDLANRLKVEISTVTRIEQNEISGVVKLETMRRIADELGCDFVYGFVPKDLLEQRVQQRAKSTAAAAVKRTQHTMALEGQALSQRDLDVLVNRRAARELERGALWKTRLADGQTLGK